MKRLSLIALLSTLVLVLLATVGVAGASAKAQHTQFTGSIGIANPCNGETVSGTGPTRIVYVERKGGFVVHFTFKVTTTGSLGHTYVLSFVANGQFAAPSGSGAGFTFFDVPVHSQVVSKGSAPNFSFELGVRIFVAGGVATGASFIGPSSTTCHG